MTLLGNRCDTKSMRLDSSQLSRSLDGSFTLLDIHKCGEAVERLLSPARWISLIEKAGALLYDAAKLLDHRSARVAETFFKFRPT